MELLLIYSFFFPTTYIIDDDDDDDDKGAIAQHRARVDDVLCCVQGLGVFNFYFS